MNDPKDLIDMVSSPDVSGIFPLGRREGDQPEGAAIQVQLESQSGKIYFASLTVQAAQNMVAGLSKWQPVRDFL